MNLRDYDDRIICYSMTNEENVTNNSEIGIQRMTMLEAVDYLLNQEGKGEHEIMKMLKINKASLGAYKAHLTRKGINYPRKRVAKDMVNRRTRIAEDRGSKETQILKDTEDRMSQETSGYIKEDEKYLIKKESYRDILERSDKYMHNTYIVIPTENIKKLRLEQFSAFIDVLDNLFSEGLEKKVVDSIRVGKQLSSEEIKNIVLEYKRQGRPNKEIYGDFRLKNVKEYVIRGILAAHTKGVYNK